VVGIEGVKLSTCCVFQFHKSILTVLLLQLPRSNKTCPKCKTEDAVFFQSQQRTAETGMVSIWHLGFKRSISNFCVETFLCLLWLRSYLSVEHWFLRYSVRSYHGVWTNGIWSIGVGNLESE
jgi:hypothetical protein